MDNAKRKNRIDELERKLIGLYARRANYGTNGTAKRQLTGEIHNIKKAIKIHRGKLN